MSELRLGVSSYSYWHFSGPKVTIPTVIEKASDSGFLGVEVIEEQLDSLDNAHLNKIKRHAFQNGVNIYNLASSQDFVWQDAIAREENVEKTKKSIDIAYQLGAASMRVNAGWWRDKNSPGLLDSKGWVTPWEGFSNDDGFAWAIEALIECADYAKDAGIQLLLENHWGLTTTADGMLKIIKGVNSPWLRTIIDTGNFYYEDDYYEAMEKIMPFSDLIHAKTYPGGGTVLTVDIDYARVFKMMKDADFKGYVTLEMEGKAEKDVAVPESAAELKRIWQQI
ncbi:MAG TPA: sugar phosphate isomerase/epimerase [Trueperaceae bacterium]|nr:sugar phosphate isomerase/epimerase [Trueperaceae bacterium]